MNLFSSFTIVSAERSEYIKEVNEGRTETLHRQLLTRGLEVIQATGSYYGREEASFIVIGEEDGAEFNAVLQLARRYGQESVLHVDSNRRAVLIYIEGRLPRIEMGRFETLTEDEARKATGFTKVGSNYYVAR